MRPHSAPILWILVLVSFVAPLAVGVAGMARGRRRATPEARSHRRWDPGPSVGSTLLCAIAFNLVFIVQEVFLAVPKALAPGLHATLYHNNHSWSGSNPIARLLQGCGALAIFAVGLVAVYVLARRPPRSATVRLFVIWIAFNGLFQSLPQVVAGAVLPQNDVGMAMDYLHLGRGVMIALALAAMVAMVAAGTWLEGRFIEMAPDAAMVASPAGRMAFVFREATIPAVAAVPAILLFRVPGALDQVVMVPVAVVLLGLPWVQATAWRAQRGGSRVPVGRVAIRAPFVILLVLLVVFQVLLRPGVSFG